VKTIYLAYRPDKKHYWSLRKIPIYDNHTNTQSLGSSKQESLEPLPETILSRKASHERESSTTDQDQLKKPKRCQTKKNQIGTSDSFLTE